MLKKSKIQIIIEMLSTIEFNYSPPVANSEGISAGAFMNPIMFLEMIKDTEYRKQIMSFQYLYCDSILLRNLFWFANKKRPSRITGPSFFKEECNKNSENHVLIGGKNINDLEDLAENLELANPILISPPFVDVNNFNFQEYAKQINDHRPEKVWVGLGAPKQEKFITRIIPELELPVTLYGIGAAFDFYKDNSKLPPTQRILGRLGLEWVYRLFSSPSKMTKRLLVIFSSLPLLILSAFKKRYL